MIYNSSIAWSKIVSQAVKCCRDKVSITDSRVLHQGNIYREAHAPQLPIQPAWTSQITTLTLGGLTLPEIIDARCWNFWYVQIKNQLNTRGTDNSVWRLLRTRSQRTSEITASSFPTWLIPVCYAIVTARQFISCARSAAVNILFYRTKDSSAPDTKWFIKRVDIKLLWIFKCWRLLVQYISHLTFSNYIVFARWVEKSSVFKF